MSTFCFDLPDTVSASDTLDRGADRACFLMCRPTLYDVHYVINPWMDGNVLGSSRELAMAQWQELHDAVTQVADIVLVAPEVGSPDMVFTANAGLERDGIVVLSSFCHPERQGEEAHFRRWFLDARYTVLDLSRETPCEGEGDALFAVDGEVLWAGFGTRTALSSHECLRDAWGVNVLALELVDSRFYHLDTCFAPLQDGSVLYYPAAFSAESRAKIEAYYPQEKRIAIDELDAMRFACNAINVGRTIIVNCISSELRERLGSLGFVVVEVALGEFLKAGGSAKCLVMRLGAKY